MLLGEPLPLNTTYQNIRINNISMFPPISGVLNSQKVAKQTILFLTLSHYRFTLTSWPLLPVDPLLIPTIPSLPPGRKEHSGHSISVSIPILSGSRGYATNSGKAHWEDPQMGIHGSGLIIEKSHYHWVPEQPPERSNWTSSSFTLGTAVIAGPCLQWLKYDRGFCEWAAAKSLRKQDDLSFHIYGQCLASKKRQALPSMTP